VRCCSTHWYNSSESVRSRAVTSTQEDWRPHIIVSLLLPALSQQNSAHSFVRPYTHVDMLVRPQEAQIQRSKTTETTCLYNNRRAHATDSMSLQLYASGCLLVVRGTRMPGTRICEARFAGPLLMGLGTSESRRRVQLQSTLDRSGKRV
jgi:hypothetical protein